ncbi:hypothetical protein, partial [Xanthomonas hortorum]|uniref:hypothetical protein n=1 Tax=Xanthomonas hortorum TaxID=56454 RepID=UPI00204452F7
SRHASHKLRSGSRECHLVPGLQTRIDQSLIGSLPMHAHRQRRLRGRAQGEPTDDLVASIQRF